MESPISQRVKKLRGRHNPAMNLLDLLAPPSCAFCGSCTEAEEKSICRGCYEDLPWSKPAVSPAPSVLECSIAMLQYSFPVDVAIKALKFNRKLYYAPAFAEVLCSAEHLLANDIDVVLPVPLHWRRKARRGFNQATEIARPLAALLGVPLLRGVRRHKSTPFQSGLDAKQRAKNLRNAFAVSAPILHAHVLVVDDVVTTGATVRALAEELLASGTKRVSSITVARAGQVLA